MPHHLGQGGRRGDQAARLQHWAVETAGGEACVSLSEEGCRGPVEMDRGEGGPPGRPHSSGLSEPLGGQGGQFPFLCLWKPLQGYGQGVKCIPGREAASRRKAGSGMGRAALPKTLHLISAPCGQGQE